jgi:ferredoxin-NADP reductase
LLLVGAGSGIVPLMAMIRDRHLSGSRAPTRLLYSSRSFEDVIYREELDRLVAAGDGLDVRHTLTRVQPPGWTGFARRVDRAMVEQVAWPAGQGAIAYVCGPTPFVEAVAELLVGLGYSPQAIKTERFGPTGG